MYGSRGEGGGRCPKKKSLRAECWWVRNFQPTVTDALLLRLLMLLSLAQAGGPQHACSAVGLQAVVWQACVGVALALEQLCR